jgi:hypothetical protein
LNAKSVNSSVGIFKCADRVSPGDEPRDITTIKERYIPFDVTNKVVHLRKNPFGAVIYRRNIATGNVYAAFDGKRMVLEVGCSTIIYIHINPSQPSKHHRVFIQSESAFSGDTTIRRDAAIIASNTRYVETVVKYEMYFIMGVLSTVSLATWLMFTGSDVTLMYAKNRAIGDASKILIKKLTVELDEMNAYAPTLHAKILELVVTEAKSNAVGAAKKLPETIIADETVQAQVAGVIFGKWAMPNGNPFNLWTIISVILTQAAVKSVTKYGDAYLKAIDGRYKPLIDDMKNVDATNPASIQRPVHNFIHLMGEAGVRVSQAEAYTILMEISKNKDKAYKNLSNITSAIDEFRVVANR